MEPEKREIEYSSKQSAMSAMWRYYHRHIQSGIGSPLVADDGTTLQWVDCGTTRHMTVTRDGNYHWMLVRSWIEG
jgi:hypothetical protein